MPLVRQDFADPLCTILGNYGRASRRLLALMALVVAGASVANIGAPFLFSRLVDNLTAANWQQTVVYGFLVYAVLLGVALALQTMVQYLSFMSAENLALIAATSFFDRLVGKPIAFFVEHNTVEIQNAQRQGTQALEIIAQLLFIAIIPGVISVALALAVLGWVIDLQLLAIVAVYGAVFILLTYFANKWTRADLDAAIESIQSNARFVGNALAAMETLRYFRSDHWASDRFSRSARAAFESWRRFSLKRIASATLYGIALAAQVGITFVLLLPRFREGTLSVGDLVLFNALLLQLNQPFEMIGHAIDSIVRSYSRFVPFARMWAAPADMHHAAAARFVPGEGSIRFDGVGFRYADGRGVADISFTARRGRLTFITGETGSGKSTVFKLLLKSLQPTEGSISVDGTDLTRIERDSWYDAVGVVPQDILLLNDTLSANIVLGRSYDLERLRAAASRAAILARIDAMPDGFDTVVGERGLKLSGGERQRVAIARALYAEPKFLLLDEASSALDEATEAEVMLPIRALVDEVTVLAITHRKSSIHPQDHIVELRAGGEV